MSRCRDGTVERPHRSPGPAPVVLALVLLAVGCTGPADRDSTSPRDAVASPSWTSPSEPASRSKGQGKDARPGRNARTACAEQVGRAVAELRPRVEGLLGIVVRAWTPEGVRSASPSPGGAADALAERVDETARELRSACGDVPRGLRAFGQVVANRRPVDDAAMRRVLQSYSRWAAATGDPDAVGTLFRLSRICDRFERRFRVTYRAWWRSWHSGRRWWVELTYRNATGATVQGSLYGVVLASGLGRAESPVSTFADGSATVVWGGSSADYFWAAPGVSAQIVAPGADQWVDTSSSSTFDVRRVEVSAVVPGRRIACPIPVVRDSASSETR